MSASISSIGSIGNLSSLKSLPSIQNSSATGGLSFSQMLKDSIGQTNQAELSAQSAIEESLSGGDITNVEVFTAMKKADLSLRMLMQVRNKVVAAFNEIKGMQL